MYMFCVIFFGSSNNMHVVSYLLKFTSFNGVELVEQKKLLENNLNQSLHLLCWNCRKVITV